MVGGISRTVERDGWRFDIGGHRFFTKVPRGRGALARDPARRGLPAAAADEPHLLPGQVLRLPAQGRERAARTSGSSEAVRCVGSYAVGAASGRRRTSRHFEGWVVGPVRLAPLPHLLQDLHREGLGRAGRPRSRPTGPRSGSRTCRCPRRCVNALLPRRNQKDVTSAHRGVPVPEVRPRDDVGALRRAGRAKRRARSSSSTAVTRDQHRERPGASRSPRDGRRRAAPGTTCDHVISSMPISRAAAGDGPAARRPRCWPPPTTCATATSSPSRSSCPRSSRFPDNWIYVHDAGRRGRPDPELRLVVAVPGQGRPHLPRASSTSSSRATRCGRCPTRT